MSDTENTAMHMPGTLSQKKRKLRKGTRSCWECKRRKTRCVFLQNENGTCAGCQRRGTRCIDQNESDVEMETRETSTNRRLDRIETMLATLLERQEAPRTPTTETSQTFSVIDGERRALVLPNMITDVFPYADRPLTVNMTTRFHANDVFPTRQIRK